MGCPGKWNQRLKPVPWWPNFDPHPCGFLVCDLRSKKGACLLLASIEKRGSPYKLVPASKIAFSQLWLPFKKRACPTIASLQKSSNMAFLQYNKDVLSNMRCPFFAFPSSSFKKGSSAFSSMEIFSSKSPSVLSLHLGMGQNKSTRGPQVLVFGSIYQGSILVAYLDP